MKHVGAIGAAWKAESRRKRQERRKRIETAFLPAALEIMDTPPRPMGRIILWLIIAAAFTALVWAGISKVDIVAVAEGRVVPRGKLQSVETAESGIVRAILAREGDRVAVGQPLIELDPTFADADADAARSELNTALLQRARAQALLDYADGQSWSISGAGTITPGVAAAETRLVQARIDEHEARLDSLYERIAGADHARSQALSEQDRIRSTLPMVEAQLRERRELADQGYAPRLQVEELEERLNNLRFGLIAQAGEVDKAGSEKAMIRRDIAAQMDAFRAAAAAELSEAEAIIATRSEIVEKAELRSAMQTLAAPVSGVVNEITVTTIGEVAEPGQPLITLVPEGDELIIEAFLLNRDVGFVKINQEAIIKLEAYPFMRYGYLEGEIEHVSADAVIDQARGLVFPARIRVTGSTLRAGALGRDSASAEDLMTPGMTAAVEVKTGERSVISYLLSPIARSVSEAGRER
ncbi:MAG: HlyD family type I secretion periplasmic adaptor subunit [Pseudomonadota bacterium]